MDVFYNRQGIGDVLVIPLKEGNRYNLEYKSYGDIVKIADKQTEEVLGYNIFQASNYFELNTTGKLNLTEEMLNSLTKTFELEGLEGEPVIDLSPKFVVGLVKSIEKHEDADKLKVCQVDIGEKESLQIVCGAPNVDQGQRVVVAKVGAIMPSGLQIKPTELRGVPSNGMICSQKELDLPNAPKEKGIYVLSEDYSIGQAFEF
ncbi:YtpR family tRNA-binding protein [Aquibacillus salsiterrae]|uniref:DUF4479 domain-containing protein n=1 Tax=Aquibacillus salsiterrae TaxID=2950439 RepID=A0A9X4ADS4_9BACI|nr:DUF4479 domain-containing tRNA-binding protein [Aquibacillus salsiterrae]MDC3415796.1 DUF4479 domain-containing protein [Aquibacillus salsiterrae]